MLSPVAISGNGNHQMTNDVEHLQKGGQQKAVEGSSESLVDGGTVDRGLDLVETVVGENEQRSYRLQQADDSL